MARECKITSDGVTLVGDLTMARHPIGTILFAHGSGSSRHSPRNRYVAHMLQEAGMTTLLLDLLTANEEFLDEQTRHYRFDIPLLARRLVGAIDWLASEDTTAPLPLGLFGASTGAAAALIAAAQRPTAVRAVVSRGGRPDLAGAALAEVAAPTLLIVGSQDYGVIELNERALEEMQCERDLHLVPGATHLFEEPGAMEDVAALARDWFQRHFARVTQPTEELFHIAAR